MSEIKVVNQNPREIERQIVRKLIRTAKTAGWMVRHVHDGAPEMVKVRTEAQVMAAVFAVDDSTVLFKKKGHMTVGVFIAGGKRIDMLTDNRIEADFEARVMEPMVAYCNALDPSPCSVPLWQAKSPVSAQQP
ncbi:MAG: hypothetical protein ACOYNZ_02155 [Rhodoferax sp.]